MNLQAVRSIDPPQWRPARGSQCERILAVLLDGEAHLVSEIHSLAGFSRLNSRVSELRKHGWLIESFHNGKGGSEGYGYQLITSAGADSIPESASGSPTSTCPTTPAVQLELA